MTNLKSFILKFPLGLAVLCILAFATLSSSTRAQGPPVFEVTPVGSSIKFFVKSSVALEGDFKKWNATLVFTSPDFPPAF
jgi:hypothetical protein